MAALSPFLKNRRSGDAMKKLRHVEVALPYPPSVNRYWRSVNGRVVLSREGRAYREHAQHLARQSKPFRGEVWLRIVVSPPDRRNRDMDNVLKAILDALQHAGVYLDDSQVSELYVRRCPVKKGGSVYVCAGERPKQ